MSQRPAAAGALALLLLAAGCSAPEVPAPYAAPPPPPFSRGVHYFGSAWPINFWNSAELEQLPRDLERIRADGFDLVVLVVPWREFQPGIDPPRYDDALLARLRLVVAAARAHGLKVLLRIGYTWDFVPAGDDGDEDRAENPNVLEPNRALQLLTDPGARSAWLDYVATIHGAVAEVDPGAGAFITWEDYFSLLEIAWGARLPVRLALADAAGYQDFVASRHSMQAISGLYRLPFPSRRDIPLPEHESAATTLLLDYMDHVLVDELWRPASARWPGLSMEVRMDPDPVMMPGNRLCDYDHSRTFRLPGVSTLYSYFTTAWGALNRGDVIGAGKAIGNAERALDSLRRMTPSGSHLFIDQLNVMENNPDYSDRTRISSGELPAFVEGLAGPLARATSGYALWAYRDYAASAIYNAAFELYDRGWQLDGGAAIVTEEGDRRLRLPAGASATQIVPRSRVGRLGMYRGATPRVTFRCRAPRPPATVEISFGPNDARRVTVPFAEGAVCVDAPPRRSYALRLAAMDGEIVIDEVALYAFAQEGGVYDLADRPRPLAAAFRRLNAALARGAAP